MESGAKPDDVKRIHSQHARILKEDEEFWISSEDLNTENSSDDDRSKTKHAFKKKLKLKNRKRSSPNIRLQRPSIPSVPSTSKALDDRLLMPVTDDTHSRSTDESRTSDDEYQAPPMSSECLLKRLSMEDWRPMKGALNISSIEESSSAAGDARKNVNETGNFYDAMLDKLESLKSCPSPQFEQTFKELRNTPEVKEKLDFINKLDLEINDTINRYKVEREERLSTEFEMCQALSKEKLHEERDVDKFLEMCNFQDQLTPYRDEDPTQGFSEEGEQINEVYRQKSEYDFPYFIKKNIDTAKQGAMASFSLTDEEKAEIADILKDLDDCQLEDVELSLSSTSITEVPNQDDGDFFRTENAYSLGDCDKLRLDEIDSELKKLTDDRGAENLDKETPVVKDEEFWKKFVLEQSLKDIDAQLDKLYASYIEDEKKLRQNNNFEDNDDSG